MAEKTTNKITKDELLKFNNFITRRQQILNNLGTSEVHLKAINIQKENLFSDLQKLDVLESDFTQELTGKYGKVSVDVNTGDISSI